MSPIEGRFFDMAFCKHSHRSAIPTTEGWEPGHKTMPELAHALYRHIYEALTAYRRVPFKFDERYSTRAMDQNHPLHELPLWVIEQLPHPARATAPEMLMVAISVRTSKLEAYYQLPQSNGSPDDREKL